MFILLNNPWVIGIGGGVISGFLVFFVTQFIFNNGRAADYRRRIDATNREVINALRPSIPEEKIPDRAIVDALIHATARKYNVAFADVYDCATVGEELIKRVIDSGFISAKQKAEYSEALRTMMPAEPVLAGAKAERAASAAEGEVVRSTFEIISTWMAALLGVITAAMTVALALLGEEPATQLQRLAIPTGVTLFFTAITMSLLFLSRQARRDHVAYVDWRDVEIRDTKPVNTL